MSEGKAKSIKELYGDAYLFYYLVGLIHVPQGSSVIEGSESPVGEAFQSSGPSIKVQIRLKRRGLPSSALTHVQLG